MPVTDKGKGPSVGDSNARNPDGIQVVVSVPKLQPETARELIRLRAENTDCVAEAHVSANRIVAVWHHDLCVFFVTRTLILA